MVLSRAAALVCRGNKTEKEVAKFFETFIHSQMKPKELHTPRPVWKLTKIHNYKHFNFSSLEQYFCTSWYSDRAVKSLSTSWQQTQTDLHLGSKEMLLNTVMCCLQVKYRSCQLYTKKASPLFLHTVLKSSASSFPRSKHIKLKLLFLLPPHTKRYELDAVTNLSMKHLKNIFSHGNWNLPKVMYPTLSPVLASVSWSSRGGSLWLNNTWGACWYLRLPSLNSCRKTWAVNHLHTPLCRLAGTDSKNRQE